MLPSFSPRFRALLGLRTLLPALLGVACLQADARADLALGEASNYNLFVFNNYYQKGADVEGRIAVGGNATILDGFGAAQNFKGSNPVDDRMVIGGNLTWKGSGRVYNNGVGNGLGNIRVGGVADVNAPSVTFNQLNKGDLPFSFAAVEKMLQDKSSYWSTLTPNGNAENKWGTLTLSGTNSDLVVFSLNASELINGANGLNTLKFKDIPSTATVLVNVVGKVVSMTNFGFDLGGLAATNILFNFVDAEVINMGGVGFNANILAPYATMNFGYGQINGSVIAENVGTANNPSVMQFNALGGAMDYLFNGKLPSKPKPPVSSAAPEPGTLGLAGVGVAVLAVWKRRRSKASA